MKNHPLRVIAVLVLFAGLVALFAGCGAGGSSTTGSEAPKQPKTSGDSFGLGDKSELQSITELCGTKPIKLALADGFGGNTWRKIARAEMEEEASKCPNIEEILYTDGEGDPQKSQADINSLVAKGVNVLIVFPDAGPVLLPALKKAYDAGVTVIPYNGYVGGKAGTDYTEFVGQDQEGVGAAWGAWISKAVGDEGEIAYLGGVPGNPTSEAFFRGVMSEVSKHPKMTMLEGKPIDTNWDPAQEQRVVSGLLAQHPHIAGLVGDYGVSAIGAVRAFQNANLSMVPMAQVDTNGLSCLWKEIHAENPNFQLMTVGGTTQIVRLALRKGVASYEGTKDTEPSIFPVFVYEDTLGNKPVHCDPQLPPDAALSSALSNEELLAAVR